jgi:amino acid adenylation domain-containing protein
VFLLDGEVDAACLTYAALDRRARIIAARLSGGAAPGDRILLIYPPGLEYIAAFFGCLYAGMIAVPAYPPNPARLNRTLGRLRTIVQDARPVIALTTSEIRSIADLLAAQDASFEPIAWVATDTLDDSLADAWSPPNISSATLAFLQYTSGSTATPKGVMLSHGNLLHNSAKLNRCFGHSPASRGVIWLPPYHDAGLIGGIIQPLYTGCTVTLMSPVNFLQRPVRWLQAITRYQATTSGGPNSAYELCARKITPSQRATLDLSSWTVAFNGAEPIQAETLERFAEAFAPCGFRKEAFYPCYGLAESALIVSGGETGAGPLIRSFRSISAAHDLLEVAPGGTADAHALVCSGRVLPDEQLVVVNPETLAQCGTGQVGEIWVASPSVAQGYWERSEESARIFRQRLADHDDARFLRTGDLGFLHDGELFITGRLKELMIIRGRNYYPQDIELSVERSHPAFRPGGGAAFSVVAEGQERLVIVQELDRRLRTPDVEALAAIIRQAVAEQHEVHTHAVVLIKHGTIPKTSSGKIRRHAAREAFLAGRLEVIGSHTLDSYAAEAEESWAAEAQPHGSMTNRLADALAALSDPVARQAVISSYLREQIARILHISPAGIDPQQPLSALGIDSLMAIELKYALETELGLVAPLEAFFQEISLAGLTAQILADGLEAPARPLHSLASGAGEPSEAPLSHGQRAIWFLHQLAPTSAAYNIASVVRIPAELNIPALRRTFQALIDRHPSLRTAFPGQGGEPIQRTLDWLEAPFQIEDAGDWSEARLNEFLAQEAQRPFDVERGPLLRVVLSSRSVHDHVLLLVVHHIVADFWSLAVLVDEMGACYAAEQAGAPFTPDPLPAHYADYVRWQIDSLTGSEGTRLWSYWRQRLAGDLPALDLPTDRPRPPIQTYRGAAQALRLDGALTQKLKEFSRDHGVTLYMALLAAFQALLHRYTKQPDIIVGSPTAGRSRAELARLIGYFINPVVLRADLSGDPLFADFLKQVRRTVPEAFAHQDYPFGLLVERLQPDRDPSRSPIFQVVFTFQKAPLRGRQELAAFAVGEAGVRIDLGELTLESMALEQRHAQFDLTLAAAEGAGGLIFSLQYNCDLFDAATIQRMLAHLHVLLEGSVAQPEQRISSLPLLSPIERQQLLLAWNATHAEYPTDACIHELFAAQAARTPDAVALSFETQDARRKTMGESDPFVLRLSPFVVQLTYAALDTRANRLAHYLRTLGVAPGALVGLCMERSIDMVVGLLGILKAGAAYLPLDPTYPQERLAFMLADAQATVLVTQDEGTQPEALYDLGLTISELKHPDNVIVNRKSEIVNPDNLAYVIYTSGSTGTPKGVQIRHRSVVNFLHTMRQQPGLTERDVLLSVTTLGFDIAALELFLPLVVGARLALVDHEAVMDGARLARLLSSYGITCMQATPAAWRLLLEAGWPGDPKLKILCGGEALPRDLANRLAERCGVLWNMYGPTETTIWSTACRIERGEDQILIGRPIANTQVYILDARFSPAPIGVPGELYIGGDGLARGYLNRPDLTAERFVPNPFVDKRRRTKDEGSDSSFVLRPSSGTRLYKTGDLARWRADGRIEFLGRQDHQIKLRGYRIELAEIEARLVQHPTVREAVVIVREDMRGDQRLVAYVVPTEDERRQTKDEERDPSPVLRPSSFVQELRAFLQEHLPAYMVPSAFVSLGALPLTPNDKLDRAALPAPDGLRPASAATYVAPRGELERAIAQIWQETLGVEKAGVHDNFFDLGGHSLLMVRVHRRLRERLKRDLTMVELFQYPTISALARYLSPAEGEWPVSEAGHERAQQRRALMRRPEAGVAVIGMAGRFPGAHNLDTFWQNLCDGTESISFFSDSEIRLAGIDAELLDNPHYVKAGAVLDAVAQFDATFFGYTPREAELLDPQHRLFLECAWEALERAGYDSERYPGRIGVYAGVGLNAYLLNNLSSHRDLMQSADGYQTFIGNDKDFVPTRVSYKLNLRGPSVNVQTACSSSLVAIHLACQSLLTGECDMALAGGVSINLPQQAGYVYQERGIASRDGHCRAFDAEASGTVRGSGVGVVILKRLAEALADGDAIVAVIKGSAINNDGAIKVGYTAPSVEGQAEVIDEALAMAGVAPGMIGYVETHGTGTEMGDPIEVAALIRAFRISAERPGMCALGSVKTNIGHLDTAAGVAGFIKTALALQRERIPASLHFRSPNPQIDFENGPFYVNAALAEWPRGRQPRRAGVSAFGIGGTNAHVVLEEAPLPEPSGESRPWQLLLLSAKTATALETASAQLAAHLKAHPDLNLADVAYTLQAGRHIFPYRRALVCRDHGDAAAAFEGRDPARVLTAACERKERSVVFMFPGQGAQYVGMAYELYQTEPTFRRSIDYCSELLLPHLGLDIRDVLYPTKDGQPPTMDDAGRRTQDEDSDSSFVLRPASDAGYPLDQTWLAQPALFIVEYALAKLWMEWGVRPAALIGHSIGEYVAACLAGVFSLEDALALIAARGRLMQQLPGGAMLAVSLHERDVRPLLDETLFLAAVNAPGRCVVSGPVAGIERLERRLAVRDVDCRRLHTSHAFHSAMMDPILVPFAQQVGRCARNAPQMPYISNVTGTWATAVEALAPGYWSRHLREPVRFADGLSELLKDQDHVLLEIGPGRALSTLAQRHPGKAAEQMAIASLPHAQAQQSDQAFLLAALGKLWLAGVPINAHGFYAHERRRRVPLPTYPFERQRYWIEPQPRTERAQRAEQQATARTDISDWFYAPSWKRSALARQPGGPRVGPGWLVFVDECGLGSQLAEQLEKAGQAEHVTIVRAGPAFAQLGDHEYTLDPAQPASYDALLQALDAQQNKPQTILHLWSVTANDHAMPALARAEHALDVGFYSLLFLAQALGRQQVSGAIRIVVISNGLQEVTGEERLHPEKAILLGSIQTIPHEYPNIHCRSIDVILPPPEVDVAQKLLGSLLAEITVASSEPIVTYRGNHRWVQTFEPVRLAQPEGPAPGLREGGVYMITGGLGGMGLVLARHLAETARARLILTGRSALPAAGGPEQQRSVHAPHDPISRVIDQVRELEALGAEALVIRADVADQAAMKSAVAQALKRFGRIDGVIHAAGVPGGGMIQLKTRAMAEQVMAAKVKGALVLADVLEGLSLDFVVLCSSINAVVGRLGQVDYAAANAFLAAFAHTHAQPTICIDWETWREVGMAAEMLKAASGTNGPHPLLKECLLKDEEQSIYLTRFAIDNHWALREHGMLGQPTLPGTTYLEMARAAFAACAGDGAIEIRDAHFLTPLIVEDSEKQVRTILKRQGDAYAFSMMSQVGDTWQEHARGMIAALDRPAPSEAPLSEIEGRCGEQTITNPLERARLGGFDLQRRTIQRRSSSQEALAVDAIVIVGAAGEAQALSMEFGPRWHSLVWVKLGAREGLARLELPEAFSADFQSYRLHPALLDFATSFLRLFKGEGNYLPLSYKRLRMWRPLPARLYSYARFADRNRSRDATLCFDVLLLNEDGATLAEIEEFTVMRIDDIARIGAPARSSAASRDRSPDGLMPRGSEARVRLLQEDLREGLSSSDGVAVFDRILASGLRRVVVSTRDLSARIEQSRARSAALLAGPAQGADADAPQPKYPRPQLMNAYAAPRNETEQKLAEIWQDVLGIAPIGIHDNFFEIGGDSLLITRIHTLFVERFDKQASVASLLQYPTIADLAQFLREQTEDEQLAFEEVQDRTSKQKTAMKQRQQKLMKKRISV